MTDLRTQLAQAFSKTATAKGVRLGRLRFALAHTALTMFDDQAQQRLIDDMMERTRIRDMDFRNGVNLEIQAAREVASLYVAAARTMLGDAENYSETPVSSTVKVAESPEQYVLIVQRAGKLTPHQARKRAEAERDALAAQLSALAATTANLSSCPALTAVPYERITTYLREHGWCPTRGYAVEGIDYWWHAQDESDEAQIYGCATDRRQHESGASAYGNAEFVNDLARVEDRPAFAVLADLLALGDGDE